MFNRQRKRRELLAGYAGDIERGSWRCSEVIMQTLRESLAASDRKNLKALDEIIDSRPFAHSILASISALSLKNAFESQPSVDRMSFMFDVFHVIAALPAAKGNSDFLQIARAMYFSLAENADDFANLRIDVGIMIPFLIFATYYRLPEDHFAMRNFAPRDENLAMCTAILRTLEKNGGRWFNRPGIDALTVAYWA